MLEEFEAARRKRDGATVGGETGVAQFEDGHNNAPLPQSGNHTQDKTRLKKLSKARCHQRNGTLNKEYGTPARPTAESTHRTAALHTTALELRRFKHHQNSREDPKEGQRKREFLGQNCTFNAHLPHKAVDMMVTRAQHRNI